MKIITVSGAHSGVGKTTRAELLLRQRRGWSALKVTTVKDTSCPRKAACGICAGQKEDFTIISNADTINQEGTDTGRMKAAGAKTVLWLRARPEGLKQGLAEALQKLKGSPGVVIEGTSVLKHIKPDVRIFLS